MPSSGVPISGSGSAALATCIQRMLSFVRVKKVIFNSLKRKVVRVDCLVCISWFASFSFVFDSVI